MRCFGDHGAHLFPPEQLVYFHSMFRIWISRSGSIPIREQLSAQLLFGILSHRLHPGERLPSVREMARRIKMHPNTVSAAYSDLVDRGWLKRKSGSGVFVGDLAPRNDHSIDAFVQAWIAEGAARGFSPEAIRAAFEAALRGHGGPFVVVHPDLEFARILAAEIEEACGAALPSATIEQGLNDFTHHFLLTTASAVAPVAEARPDRHSVIVLKSVEEFLAGPRRITSPSLIAIVSRSESVLTWASLLTRSLGLAGSDVIRRNPNDRGWQDGLGACDLIAADVLARRELPRNAKRIYDLRLIAPSFLEKARELVTGQRSVTST